MVHDIEKRSVKYDGCSLAETERGVEVAAVIEIGVGGVVVDGYIHSLADFRTKLFHLPRPT